MSTRRGEFVELDELVVEVGADAVSVVRNMLELEEVINRSVEELTPQALAYFALDLAGMFHPVYDRVRVLSDQDDIPEDVQKARLRFYRAAKVVFARVL